MGGQEPFKARVAEEIVAGIAGFDQAIGKEDQAVAVIQPYFSAGIICIGSDREQQAPLLQRFHPTVSAAKQRCRMPCARVEQFALNRVDKATTGSHKCAGELAAQHAVHVSLLHHPSALAFRPPKLLSPRHEPPPRSIPDRGPAPTLHLARVTLPVNTPWPVTSRTR